MCGKIWTKKTPYLSKNSVLAVPFHELDIFITFFVVFHNSLKKFGPKFPTAVAAEEVVSFYPNDITQLTRIENEFHITQAATRGLL